MLRRIGEQLARCAGQLFIRPMMVNHDPLRCGSILHKLAAMQNGTFAGSSIGYSTKLSRWVIFVPYARMTASAVLRKSTIFSTAESVRYVLR